MKGLFITGTDTDVGKTYSACLIARSLVAQGYQVIPRKPVESGCLNIDHELQPSDALKLMAACDYKGKLQQVCPFRFEPAISPARAAKLKGQSLPLSHIICACKPTKQSAKELLLVEGAGGFYSPLCDDALNADLAQALNLPIVLVAQDKLGCINQVLLTVEAIQARGLTLICILLNRIKQPQQGLAMDNFKELKELLDIPLITLETDAIENFDLTQKITDSIF